MEMVFAEYIADFIPEDQLMRLNSISLMNQSGMK